MIRKVGERVGALVDILGNKVRLIGYGVYEGYHTCPLGFDNPRIKLDKGGHVWGYECWWGAEERIRESVEEKRTIKNVTPVRDAKGELVSWGEDDG